jgi:hypothetical protein
LAALELLQSFYQQTGRNISLFRVVSEHVEILKKLNGRNPSDAIDGYLNTVASVKRKDVSEAVEEFIKADEPRTKAGEGQRAQLSSEYARIRALRLRGFAKAFPQPCCLRPVQRALGRIHTFSQKVGRKIPQSSPGRN